MITTWYRGWLPDAYRLPWPGGFPHLSLPSWCGRGSSQRSGFKKTVADQNLVLVSSNVIWGTRPGCAEIIWSIEVMASGLVSKGFIIDLPKCLPLNLDGLLWDLPNSQVTQGGGFTTLLILLVIITLLDNTRMYFKYKWFILGCQTRSSLSPCCKSSSLEHSLAMYSFVILDTTTCLYNSYKLGGGVWMG